MNFSIFFLIILVPLLFGIPILVSIYVYRDAARRGMNAVLWMLVALLAPSLLGFIIYLLVRNNYSDLKCPVCDTPVQESFVVCPNCRTKLRPTCDVCSAPVQTGWKVCPHCGSQLSEYSGDITPPARKKDNTLWKILIAIIAIPVLLIGLMITAAAAFSFSGGTSTSHTSSFASMTVEEYLENSEQREDIENWISSCNNRKSTKPIAHILQYNVPKENPENQLMQVQYLIYIPGASGFSTSSLGLSKKALQIDIDCGEDGTEQQLFVITFHGESPSGHVAITYNGNETEEQITFIHQPLCNEESVTFDSEYKLHSAETKHHK